MVNSLSESTKEILFCKDVPLILKQSSRHNTDLEDVDGSSSLGISSVDHFQEKRLPQINVKVSLTSKNSGRVKVVNHCAYRHLAKFETNKSSSTFIWYN